MLYFSTAPAHPDSIDPQQYKDLKEFKDLCHSNGLVETYDNLSEFRLKLARQLAITVNDNSYLREHLLHLSRGQEGETNQLTSIAIAQSPMPNLTKEAKELLIQASEDQNGIVMATRSMSGLEVQTNGIEFTKERSARSQAMWEAAVSQLVDHGLIHDQGYRGEVFSVTRAGYEVADIIKSSSLQ